MDIVQFTCSFFSFSFLCNFILMLNFNFFFLEVLGLFAYI